MSALALPHIPLSTQHKDPGRGQGPCPPAPTVAGEEEALPGGECAIAEPAHWGSRGLEPLLSGAEPSFSQAVSSSPWG